MVRLAVGDDTSQTLLDALPGPAALLDPSGRVAHLNERLRSSEAVSTALGAPLSRGFCFFDPGNTGFLADVEALIREVVRSGAAKSLVLRRGEEHALRVQVLPHGDARTPVLLLVEDVTHVRRAEQALRVSDERLKMALQATGDGLFEWFIKTGEVKGNARLREMLGYGPEELAQVADWEQITHPQDLARVSQALKDHLTGKAPLYEAEVRLRTKDGAWRWILDRGQVIERDARGHAIRFAGLHTDITARMALEEQVRMAGQLSAVGTLSAGLAHEINTPLTALSNSLIALSNDLHPEPAALSLAREAASAVQQIVRDVKALSRFEEQGARVRTNVAHALELALRLTRSEVRARAVLVEKLGAVPQVLANESRLGQVFVNLILNAAQALSGPPAEQRVEVSCFTNARGWAEISVRDTGDGVPADIAPRIFDPFFTTKPVGVGTGLGLSICHRIVSDLGGEISFETEPGKGTTFRVVLPPEAEPARSRDGGRKRLLVVDDHRAVGVSLQLLLRDRHEVEVVTRSEDALSRIAAGELFDLILCDLTMPGMNGMQLFEAVKRSAPDAAARFVFMTGGAIRPEAREFLATTVNPVLEKPFRPEALTSMLSASGT